MRRAWREGQTFSQASLLQKTVGDYSEWKTGRRDDVEDAAHEAENLPAGCRPVTRVAHVAAD